MKSHPRTPAKPAPVPAGAPAKKRFRIEKLEERVAPAGHYNSHTKWVGGGGGGGDTGGCACDSIGGSIY